MTTQTSSEHKAATTSNQSFFARPKGEALLTFVAVRSLAVFASAYALLAATTARAEEPPTPEPVDIECAMCGPGGVPGLGTTARYNWLGFPLVDPGAAFPETDPCPAEWNILAGMNPSWAFVADPTRTVVAGTRSMCRGSRFNGFSDDATTTGSRTLIFASGLTDVGSGDFFNDPTSLLVQPPPSDSSGQGPSVLSSTPPPCNPDAIASTMDWSPGPYSPMENDLYFEVQRRATATMSARQGPFWAPSGGGFVTPGQSLGDTSVALVPNGASQQSTSWGGHSRPTVDSVVDLATGKPLLSMTDLEIPFGSAVFRLRRTKSDEASSIIPATFTPSANSDLAPAATRGWDWAGGGWMMSEAPVLIVDSAWAPVVGNNPRTCYLTLDAHHSIPFQQLEDSGEYEAPARFQARLSHNGVWNVVRREWATPPSMYRATLFGGQLHYTFVVMRDDLSAIRFSSPVAGMQLNPDKYPVVGGTSENPIYAGHEHMRPWLFDQFPPGSVAHHSPMTHRNEGFQNPGLGLPYTAICVRIEDNFGHRVDIDYCSFPQFNADFDIAFGNNHPSETLYPTPCTECVQACVQKGQIRSIQLSANGVHKWVLLYSYRATPHRDLLNSFSGDYNWGGDPVFTWPLQENWFADISGPRVLDRIYVFRSDLLDGAILPECSVHPAMHEHELVAGGDDSSRLSSRSQTAADTFASQHEWDYCVTYHHMLTPVTDDNEVTKWFTRPNAAPIMVTTRSRTYSDGNQSSLRQETTTSRVILYANSDSRHNYDDTHFRVNAILEPDELAELISTLTLGGAAFGNNPACGLPAIPDISPEHLALWIKPGSTDGSPDSLSSIGSFCDPLTTKALVMSRATVAIGFGGPGVSAGISNNTDVSMSTGPSWNALTTQLPNNGRSYIQRSNTSAYMQLNGYWDGQTGGVASLAVSKQADGTPNFARLIRFAVTEPNVTTGPTGLMVPRPAWRWTFHPSVFNPPYSWHAYRKMPADSIHFTPGEATGETVQAPDLTAVRWITVVDRFDTWASMMASTPYGQADGPHVVYGTKPGQMSRQVVEVNASGVVLRDRTWEFRFDEGEVQLASSGLGEEFVYETAPEVLARVSGGAGSDCDSTPPTNCYTVPPPPSPTQSSDDPSTLVTEIDHYERIRRELVLVERRGIGWAAADRDGVGASQGLTFFYLHKPTRFEFDTDPDQPGAEVKVLEPTLVAEGICSGQFFIREGTGPLAPNVNRGVALVTRYSVSAALSDSPSGTGNAQLVGPELPWTGETAQGWQRDVQVSFTTPITIEQFAALVGEATGPTGTEGDWNRPIESCRLRVPPIMIQADSVWEGHSVVASNLLVKRAASLPGGTSLPTERPVVQSLRIGPPVRQRPEVIAANTPYFSMLREWFDDRGRKTWTAEGLVRDPINPQPVANGEELQTLTWSRFIFDDLGRPQHIVVDLKVIGGVASIPSEPHLQIAGRPALPIDNPAIWELPPNAPARIPSSSEQSDPTDPTRAREFVTTYAYTGDRLTDVFFPNGRRWASRVITISRDEQVLHDHDQNPSTPSIKHPDILAWNNPSFDDPTDPADGYNALLGLPPNKAFAREYIFSELEVAPGTEGRALRSRVVGEIKDYATNDTSLPPTRVRRVFYADSAGDRFGPEPNPIPLDSAGTPNDISDDFFEIRDTNQPRFVLEAAVQMQQNAVGVDSSGRVQSASLLEPDANGAILAVGSKDVNELVDMRRVREMDNTITRTTMNLLGFPMRTYVGTEDIAWTTGAGADNLVLAERYGHGNSSRDAWLQNRSWKYRTQPDWASSRFVQPEEDIHGAVTETQYDWRMRPVRVDEYDYPDAAAPSRRLRTTLNYFDHADRLVCSIVYGADHIGELAAVFGPLQVPTQLDPVNLTGTQSGLRPSQIPGVSWTLLFDRPGYAPISVTENFYGTDGSVYERREYDVSAYVEDPLEPGTYEPPASLRYQSYYNFRGNGNHSVYSQSPGEPVAISTADSLGRLVRTDHRLFNPGVNSESWVTYASTRSILDADGNAVDVRSLERLANADALIASLSDGSGADPNTVLNAVRQRTVNWFDPTKRVDATLTLGTEQSGGYLLGPALFTRPLGQAGDNLRPALNVIGGQLVRQIDPTVANAGGLLTINRYNIATGRITHVRHPDDTITETLYDPAGRVKTVIENREGAAENQRRTDYEYKFGRLVKILTGTGATPATSVSEVRYGAEVLEYVPDLDKPTYVPKSFNNSLVGRMHRAMIGTSEEPASEKVDLSFAYTFNGLLARRTDGRGVTFQYFYDGLDRLIEIQVGRMNGPDFKFMDLPDSMQVNGSLPSSIVHRVLISYDPRGLVEKVTAYGPGGSEIVSDVAYVYDAKGLLRREVQTHGEGVADPLMSDRPSVDYDWEYQATSGTSTGYTRLIRMVYPFEGMPHPPRAVLFDYGIATDANNLLSRVGAIATRAGSMTTRTVSAYTYAGTSRRVAATAPAVTRENSIPSLAEPSLFTNSQLGNASLGGLDRFGRNQFWAVQAATPTNTTSQLAAARYTYDIMGNRIAQDISQVAYATGAPARSQVHAYDLLNRLISSKVGQITYGPSGPMIAVASLLRSDEWTLDAVGNWAGSEIKPGRQTDATTASQSPLAWGVFNTSTGGQVPWSPASTHPMSVGIFDVTHDVNAQSEIESVLQQIHAQNPTSAQTTFFHDDAGNLKFDGQYYYSYDAWNRIVQINKASLPQPQPPPAELGIEDVIIGDLVRHYTYDGLGRLIRSQFPYVYVNPNSTTNQSVAGLRSERYYYDGIRRIQTITIDEVATLSMAMTMGSSSPVQQVAESVMDSAAEVNIIAENGAVLSSAELDGDSTPMAVEAEFVELLVAQAESSIEDPFPTVIRLHREYIWGPGDNGVDELVAYFGDNRQEAYWTIQDAGGDVVAVIDDNGAPRTVTTASGSVQVPTARVVAQWTYDAFGDVLSADYFAAHPTCDAGHKGLFVDRLDMQQALQAGNYTTDTPPKLVPYAHAIYHNRNRTYAPGLGRFMQSDPNATGIAALETIAIHGTAISPAAMAIDLQALHTDGANFYQYLRGNPGTASDPMGLNYTAPSVLVGTSAGMSMSATQAGAIVSSSSLVGIGLGGSTTVGSLSGASALVAYLMPAVIVSAPLVAVFDSTVSGPGLLDSVINLSSHEGGTHRGHTISMHVGRTVQQLQQRLAAEPQRSKVSSFRDMAEAESAVSRAINAHSSGISNWLANPSSSNRYPIYDGPGGGYVLTRGSQTTSPGTKCTVILQKNGSTYSIVTAYPTN